MYPLLMRITLPLLCSLLLVTSGWSKEPDRTPEQATGRQASIPVLAQSFMVATANRYASETAYRILQQGGSAADAAVAATLVLTLVEPQSSGLGGGCFSLFWDQANSALHSYDGRETTPAAVDQMLFWEAGQPLAFRTAVASGRAVGVPGQLKSLLLLHKNHGKLPWSSLFNDAIALAENGFPVSARLLKLLQNPVNRNKLERNSTAGDYFYPAGQPPTVSSRLKNPQLAATLRQLAKSADREFYRGSIAQAIVAAVRQAPLPGQLTLKDLADYRAKERPAVCGPYRNYRICGIGPPSSGGISLLQMLGILQHTAIANAAPASPEAIHLFAQAGRLAFADRALYIADSDYLEVPVSGLLDAAYLRQRASQINPARDRGKSEAGKPPGNNAAGYQPGISPEQPGTSHLSIIDAEGNAVALTASIEQAFGSGIMVGGFLLNNQLTDFSFRPLDAGRPVANRVEAGKRPRSSMAPTMVFDGKQQLRLVIGSPGGSRIIPYVAQTILGVLDWQQSIQQAIDQPHYLHRNGANLDLEKGTALEQLTEALVNYGYRINVTDLNSGLQGIQISEHGLQGGSDPRREGLVLGK